MNKQGKTKKMAMYTIGWQTIRRAGQKVVSFGAHLRLAGVSALCVASALSSATPSHATTGNVVFEGTIDTNASCSVTVRQNGRFGVSGDLKTMSSKIAGGQVGLADVLAFGNYQVSAVTLPFFSSAPAGGNAGTTFQSLFSGASLLLGANFAEQAGNSPVNLPVGLSYTRISAHLVATRTGSTFPTGFYQGTIVVRCE